MVQESLLTAHQHFGQFEGNSKSEFLAWLRKILSNDLHQARRTFKGTQKRQLDRERQLQYNSSVEHPLVDTELTPSTNALVMEETLQLRQAIAKLPSDYQEVLQLHSWQQQSFVEIGAKMDRTPDAVRKLWTRAVLKLQEVMSKEENIE